MLNIGAINQMKISLIILSLVILSVIGFASYANNHQAIFNQVKTKFATDQIALSEFKHLGKTHCLDHYFHQRNNTDKNELFQMVYADTFNKMAGLTRLLDDKKMQETFEQFEENNLLKDTIDTIAFCHSLYENNGDKLYQSFIGDKNNYLVTHLKKDDDSYENIWLDIQDYLKYGRLDASRYIDGCQTYDCK